MSEFNQETNMNRRGFLKAAALTTAAAAATGTGVALLNTQSKPATVSVVPNAVPVSTAVVPAAAPVTAQSDLLAQLAAVQAENMRLQADLDAANRSLDSMRQMQTQPNQEVEILQEELGTANMQITALAGLVGLYEQLEKLDLGDKIEDSIGFVSEAFTDLIDDLPTLAEGLAFGGQMLDEFEEHVPLLESGRSWLESHLSKISTFYGSFETVLQEVADRVGPVLDMTQQWFDKILKWLPFGLGRASVQVMAAVTELIRETPNTLQGADINVAQPLDVWLQKDNGESETHLQKRLFKPLREQALQPAQTTVTKAETAQTVYEDKIVTRLTSAVENRRIIQSLITTYRENHNI
ncbi:MAG: twin-arginine translocation signal domain-containing protein [Anaerolineales bacterium]|nr:twin-arginine translocation signal domain-containing protein [Anaerolineales bacterium]